MGTCPGLTNGAIMAAAGWPPLMKAAAEHRVAAAVSSIMR